MIQKVLVNRFAAAEAFVHAVPESNAALPELPAQVDLYAPEQGREIHQADVQGLHQAARLHHRPTPLAHRLSSLRGVITRASSQTVSYGSSRAPGSETPILECFLSSGPCTTHPISATFMVSPPARVAFQCGICSRR